MLGVSAGLAAPTHKGVWGRLVNYEHDHFEGSWFFTNFLLLEPQRVLTPPQRASLFRFVFADVFWPLAKSERRFLNRRRFFTSFYGNQSIFAEYVRGNTDVGFFNQSLISFRGSVGNRRHRDRAACVPKS